MTSKAKEILSTRYQSYLKIFTDGSVSETNEVGAGFIIPNLKISKSIYLGKDYSIYTAELTAIQMALNTIIELKRSIFDIVFCVDSKSVLQSLQNNNKNERNDIVIEIKLALHSLIMNGTNVEFFWVPSHCGIKNNDKADHLAKQGSRNLNSTQVFIKKSVKEMGSLVDKHMKMNMNRNMFKHKLGVRKDTSLAFRLMLNAWRTKYCHEVKCLCKKDISINHIMIECQQFKQYLPSNYKSLSNAKDLQFSDWLEIAKNLNKSSIEINL